MMKLTNRTSCGAWRGEVAWEDGMGMHVGNDMAWRGAACRAWKGSPHTHIFLKLPQLGDSFLLWQVRRISRCVHVRQSGVPGGLPALPHPTAWFCQAVSDSLSTKDPVRHRIGRACIVQLTAAFD